MQTITPLTVADFQSKSNIVIGKVLIDTDGNGTYLELPDITDFSLDTNIENEVSRFCAYSFSITCLNTDKRYSFWNHLSSYYGWLKQGRRIKLYAGIKKSGTEYYYQWLIGRIDDYSLSTLAGQEICTITGRDFMRAILDYKLYSPNTYWGTNQTFSTIPGQVRYDMNASCKGVYIAYLDSTAPYNGSHLEEIYENTDWSYDWNTNQFCFASQRIPDFAGTNNLKIYYMTVQIVENVVGQILYLAGLFTNTAARDAWIANANYVTPTAQTIDRVWFDNGTLAMEAIRLLCEVVQYRFYFDYAGDPIFKPKKAFAASVEDFTAETISKEDIQEVNSEVYNDIIVLGEERDRILSDDETAPAIPANLALVTGFGVSTQAGLAYIKATWTANTEIDFGHYELRIKKNADTVYAEVSTIATSYIWYGMEPGVTYNVQIRSCDIYENRSAWSTAVNIVSATDAGIPAKITGPVATAIFAGIKINWTRSTENNIAYYRVERQESPDNVDWTGAWTEKVRTDSTMWLDLLLTYSKWYRYRITAYTVAGVVGVTSDFTTAVQPKQAENADIGAASIAATQLATDAVTAIKIATNAVTEEKINAAAVIASKIAANAVTEGKLAAGAVTEGKIGTAAISEVKLAIGAVTETKLGVNAVIEGKIATNAVTGTKIIAGAIIADKIAANAVTTDKLNALAITAEKIAADAIESTKIKANAITADKIIAGAIGTDKLAALAVVADKIAANSIVSDKIAASAITADKIAASAITTVKLDALAITAEKIATNAVIADKIYAGAIGTDKLAALAITADKIAASAITTVKIAALAITTDCLAANAVTAAKIYANTITANEIAAGAITATNLATDSIITIKIAAGAITGDKIAVLTITADNIAALTITAAKIAAGTITADKLSASYIVVTGAAADVNAGATTISGGKITALSITAAQIAAETITGAKIVALTITASEIAASTITGAKIATGTITADKLSASYIQVGGAAGDVNAGATTISGGKITTGSITATQISGLTITGDKIAAGTITGAKITAGTITADKLYASYIQVGDAAGDVNAGGTTISGNKITTGTITGIRLNIGSGTNEDIYFMDSGVRLYDAGSAALAFVKSGYAYFTLNLTSTGVGLASSGKLDIGCGTSPLIFVSAGRLLRFYSTGVLQFPVLTSAPTAVSGGLCMAYSGGDTRISYYNTEWEHCQDSADW